MIQEQFHHRYAGDEREIAQYQDSSCDHSLSWPQFLVPEVMSLTGSCCTNPTAVQKQKPDDFYQLLIIINKDNEKHQGVTFHWRIETVGGIISIGITSASN